MIRYNVTVRIVKPIDLVATVQAEDVESAEEKALQRLNKRFPNSVVEIVDIQETETIE